MSLAPVDSMKMGGALWFSDITVSDPYYLLPSLTAIMFVINFEVISNDSLHVIVDFSLEPRQVR